MLSTFKSRTRAMLTAWLFAFSFGGSALAQGEGQADEDANDVSESASASVAGALRLSLSADVFSSITTKNDPSGGDPEVTIESSNAGLPGSSPRLALGYAPNGNLNFGARLGFATSSAKVSIDGGDETADAESAATAFGAFLELMTASGVARPFGRIAFDVVGTTSKVNGVDGDELSGTAWLFGGGLHIFPADWVSIDLGVDAGYFGTSVGDEDTSGVGFVGGLGITGWFGARAASQQLRADDAATSESEATDTGSTVTSGTATSAAPTPPSSSLGSDGRLRLELDGARLFVEKAPNSDRIELVLLTPADFGSCKSVAVAVDGEATQLTGLRPSAVSAGTASRLSFQGNVDAGEFMALLDVSDDSRVVLRTCNTDYDLRLTQRGRLLAYLEKRSTATTDEAEAEARDQEAFEE